MSGPPVVSSLLTLGSQIHFANNIVALSLGTLGNLMVMVVMLQSHMRTNSAAVFFSAIAICDMGVLYSAIPSDMLGWNRFGNGNSYSVTTCVVNIFLFRGCHNVSMWLLLALAVDRMVAVRYPLQAKRWCTVSRAVITCVCVTVLAAIKHGHTFWTHGVQTLPGPNGTSVTINCGATSPAAQYFLTRIHPLFCLITEDAIPMISILVLNCMIIQALRGFNKNREKLTSISETRSQQTRSLSMMLLTASLLMFILVTPNLTVLTLINYYLGINNTNNMELYTFLRIITVCLALQNHALNFLVYCVSGRRFREGFINILTCKTRSINNGSVRNK